MYVRLTCTQCGHVRVKPHGICDSMSDELRCDNCNSMAFGLIKREVVERKDLMAKKKLLRFSVRLKGVGPESKKKLMSIGMNDKLELMVRDVEFTDRNGRGFYSPMFGLTIMEHQDAMLRECVECVVEDPSVKRRKAKKATS